MNKKLKIIFVVAIIIISSLGLYFFYYNFEKDKGDEEEQNYSYGTAININNREFIVLKNFYVKKIEDGIWIRNSKNVTIYNCHADNCFAGGYSGRGIILQTSNNCSIVDCVVQNAGAQGITLSQATNNIVQDCTITSDPSGGIGQSSTDYYIVVGYSQNNLIEGCKIGNFHDRTNSHVGHGFIIKDTRNDVDWTHSSNNIWRKCIALTPFGETFAAAHGCYNNTWVDCEMIGSEIPRTGHGIVSRNGAHNNQWQNIIIRDVSTGIYFTWVSGEGKELPGHHNVISNVVMYDLDQAFTLSYDSNTNIVENCVIYKTSTLFLLRREGYRNITLSNCIIDSVSNEEFTEISGDLDDLNINYTCFNNNGFPKINGTGNFEADPLFADPNLADFHLRSKYGRWYKSKWVIDDVMSPCIDKGDPGSSYFHEPNPNGGRINIGVFGNTPEASKSETNRVVSDLPVQVYGPATDLVNLNLYTENIFYVSPKGNDNSDGRTLFSPWRTLTYASSMARPGDTIYVKSGNYGFDKIFFSSSGNKTKPIYFIGYDTIPGDDPTDKNNMPMISAEKVEKNNKNVLFTEKVKIITGFSNLFIGLFINMKK